MEKFVIRGGRRLSGEIEVSGAKNAAVALIPAVLLCGSAAPQLPQTAALEEHFAWQDGHRIS